MTSVSRRTLLRGGALLAGGAAAGAAVGAGVAAATSSGGDVVEPVPTTFGGRTVAFHGPHQAGIATAPPAQAWFVAYDLRDGATRDDAARLLRLWTDDAARLTAGTGPLADIEPELAARPAGLTFAFGFGPSLFRRLGLQSAQPAGLVDIPPLKIDKLTPAWSGGDVLVQVAADDQLPVSHAVRMLTKDAASFARVRWIQRGFRGAAGAAAPGTTPRNLMGQVDGTQNPALGSADFDRATWATTGPDWFRGGTTAVVRRIRMELDTWDTLGRPDRELVIGRRLADGAPLTGGDETTPVDLDAVDRFGLSVIPEFAHVRRARARTPDEVIVRRGYNYQELGADGSVESGLVFVSYQADIGRQYVPVQLRLAELDLLNVWTTPIGSAVFAVPPGVAPGEWIGQRLLEG